MSKLQEYAVYPKSSRGNEHLQIKKISGLYLCLFIIQRVMHFLVHLNSKTSGASGVDQQVVGSQILEL